MRIFMKWHTGIAFQNTVSYHFVHPGCAFSMPQQPASHMWDIHKIISFLTNLSTKSPDKKLEITGIGKSCNSNLYGIRKTYEMDCISKITKLIFKKQLFKKSKFVLRLWRIPGFTCITCRFQNEDNYILTRWDSNEKRDMKIETIRTSENISWFSLSTRFFIVSFIKHVSLNRHQMYVTLLASIMIKNKFQFQLKE